jgi:hypothetical protein
LVISNAGVQRQFKPILLAEDADFIFMPGDTLSVVFDGNAWREVSRVVAGSKPPKKRRKKDPYLDGVFGARDGFLEPLYDSFTISSNIQDADAGVFQVDKPKRKKRAKPKPEPVLQKVEPLYRRKFNFDE